MGQVALIAAKSAATDLTHERPVKRTRRCQLGWPTCSHDTTVGQFLQGCWDTRGNTAQRRFQGTHQDICNFYERIAGIDYHICRKLGSGEYSEVFEASRLNSAGRRETYALKVYRSRTLERQKSMKDELAILAKLGTYCSQIVRLHQHTQSIDDETGLMEMKLVMDLYVRPPQLI